MKDKKRWIIIVGFFVFLVFMGVCTVVAKGIYRSGQPQVRVGFPERRNIAHEIKATGSVKQGQEFGVYVEPGLRVNSLLVRNGESVLAGDALFQVHVEDLVDIIGNKELEIAKLKSEERERRSTEQKERSELETELARAYQDFERAMKESDILLEGRKQQYQVAQSALEEYHKNKNESEKETVSGGDNSKEQLRQLELAEGEARRALEEAELSKESARISGERTIEDLVADQEKKYTAAENIARLELEYQESRLERLNTLLQQDGWVYAKEDGLIIKQQLVVGERTTDSACMLYASDSGERVVEVMLDAEQGKYAAIGDQVNLELQMLNGSIFKEVGVIGYLEPMDDGRTLVQIYMENEDVVIGQTVSFQLVKYSEMYEQCVPASSVYGNDNDGYYVYAAEEQEGILGTEWRVRKIKVNILDKNNSFCAVEGIGLTSETNVVKSYNKEIEEGAPVRKIN